MLSAYFNDSDRKYYHVYCRPKSLINSPHNKYYENPINFMYLGKSLDSDSEPAVFFDYSTYKPPVMDVLKFNQYKRTKGCYTVDNIMSYLYEYFVDTSRKYIFYCPDFDTGKSVEVKEIKVDDDTKSIYLII